jgi:CRP-like cAMP-binding protein
LLSLRSVPRIEPSKARHSTTLVPESKKRPSADKEYEVSPRERRQIQATLNRPCRGDDRLRNEKDPQMNNVTTESLKHPFLDGLREEHLEVLARCAMPVEFKTGEVLFREGDPANRFFLIQEGRVVIEAGHSGRGVIPIETLGAGDVLGWSWLFPPYYWHFDARAVEPTKAVFLYGTRLREYCDEDHDLGYEMLKRFAEVVIQRLQSTRTQLLGVTSPRNQMDGEEGR